MKHLQQARKSGTNDEADTGPVIKELVLKQRGRKTGESSFSKAVTTHVHNAQGGNRGQQIPSESISDGDMGMSKDRDMHKSVGTESGWLLAWSKERRGQREGSLQTEHALVCHAGKCRLGFK